MKSWKIIFSGKRIFGILYLSRHNSSRDHFLVPIIVEEIRRKVLHAHTGKLLEMLSKVFGDVEFSFLFFLCKDNAITLKGKHKIGQKCFLIYDIIWDGEIFISSKAALCFYIPFPPSPDIFGRMKRCGSEYFTTQNF